MRKPEYSAEKIVHAGLALRAAGKNVSGWSITEMMNGGNTKRAQSIWDTYCARTEGALAEPGAARPADPADNMSAIVATVTKGLAGC